MIKKSDSKWLPLATVPILGEPPSSTQSLLKEKADKLIDGVIKPMHVKPAPTIDD